MSLARMYFSQFAAISCLSKNGGVGVGVYGGGLGKIESVLFIETS